MTALEKYRFGWLLLVVSTVSIMLWFMVHAVYGNADFDIWMGMILFLALVGISFVVSARFSN
jgi:uncharacterized membrane protein